MRRITAYVVVASVLLSVVALTFGGFAMGIGAAVGGAFAVVNLLAMQWVGKRLLVASDKGKAIWGTLLAVKMFVAMFAVLAILSTGVIDPIGFTVGLSGLILGIVAGVLHGAVSSGPALPQEEI